MIDLEKFMKKSTAIVPILDGSFKYNRKQYYIVGACLNGWYEVELDGNNANLKQSIIIESNTDFSKGLRVIKGYTYNNSMVFQNFDVGKRKSGVEVMIDLNFNSMPTFMSVEAILWEDKRLYYYRPNYTDTSIFNVKAAYDNEAASITDIKGLTPELKTLFLFHAIEQHKFKKEQELLKRKKEIEDLEKTLQGRLILSFNRVGAKILKYSVSGKRITVDWEIEGSTQKFNSVIEADTFRVIEAGYCMSGHDRDHTVHSMVKLAESYDEDGLIHKTRE